MTLMVLHFNKPIHNKLYHFQGFILLIKTVKLMTNHSFKSPLLTLAFYLFLCPIYLFGQSQSTITLKTSVQTDTLFSKKIVNQQEYSITLSSASFKRGNDTTYVSSSNGINIPVGCAKYIYSPLTLPAGSKITGFYATFKYANDFNLPLYLYLYKTDCSGETPVLKRFGSQFVGGTGSISDIKCVQSSPFNGSSYQSDCDTSTPTTLPFTLTENAFHIRLFNNPVSVANYAKQAVLYSLTVKYILP